MAKIKAALDRLAHALGLSRVLLARARRRYKANRKRAFVANNKKLAARKRADECRDPSKFPSPTMAAHFDKRAARQGHIAFKNHQRAQFWLGRIKVLVQRIEGLETKQKDFEAELRKLTTVQIDRNRATGGTARERLQAVALASAAACAGEFTDSTGERINRSNFYSQPGSFDADHCITGPAHDHRDDCSSWFASAYKTAGLSDPSDENYTAGYTGTLVANARQVSHPQPGDAVIYGPGPGHHVEMYVGPGNKTIGHGSAPVDAGVIDLFGDGDYRFFEYV
ncbi:MAG TPA: NlpC/P60 family protein [Solirubrobacterales bacterium]|nr:NlpC/P60 family protein [Solirubrobacterales bacterium]